LSTLIFAFIDSFKSFDNALLNLTKIDTLLQSPMNAQSAKSYGFNVHYVELLSTQYYYLAVAFSQEE
jgi:hypothetical protein